MQKGRIAANKRVLQMVAPSLVIILLLLVLIFFCRGNNSWLGARVPRTVLPTMQPSTKNALSDSHRKRNGSAIVKDWSSGSPLIDLALLKEARQNNDELAGALRSRTGIAKIRNIV